MYLPAICKAAVPAIPYGPIELKTPDARFVYAQSPLEDFFEALKLLPELLLACDALA